MNKLQPSPISDRHGTPFVQPIPPWGAAPASREQMKFFRSWLVYDSALELSRTHGRINWNLIGGVALMLTVSVAGWAGIAWGISQLWR